eukprot:358859-Chlamydomonas_euryale.AAC.10
MPPQPVGCATPATARKVKVADGSNSSETSVHIAAHGPLDRNSVVLCSSTTQSPATCSMRVHVNAAPKASCRRAAAALDPTVPFTCQGRSCNSPPPPPRDSLAP